MKTQTDRYLGQLQAALSVNWEKSERGYIRRYENGSCEVFKADGIWIVLNIDNGSKWAQNYPSFKQMLAALVSEA